MATYRYQAVTTSGEKLTGEITATSTEEAQTTLEHNKLLTVSLEEVVTSSASGFFATMASDLTRVDCYLFFEDLSSLLKAGVSLGEALNILHEDAEKSSVKELIRECAFTVQKGEPLSRTFEKHPVLFSPVIINLTKAGEASGTLEKNLSVIATQLRKEHDIKQKIRGALIYPAILLGLSMAVITFMMTFVVPKLTRFFLQSKMTIPPITRVVTSIAHIVSASIIADIAVVLLIISGIVYITRTVRGRQLLQLFLARFPVTRKSFRTLSMYRYCWTMGILLGSGIDILQSLRITKNVLASPDYGEALKRVEEKVSRGTTLGEALKNEKNLFPRMVSGMTSVAEQTGSLEHMYLTMAQFYERTFYSGLKVVISVIEPVMLIIMGCVVGFIALAVVLPIYQFVAGIS